MLDKVDLLALRIKGVGPFQESPFVFEFIDDSGAPANVYLLLADNGLGKTTALECIASLMSLLDMADAAGPELRRRFAPPRHADDGYEIQLDLRLEWAAPQRQARSVVLSLFAAERRDAEPHSWDQESLRRAEATEWNLASVVGAGMIRAFAFQKQEKGLRKGGYIIERAELSRAR